MLASLYSLFYVTGECHRFFSTPRMSPICALLQVRHSRCGQKIPCNTSCVKLQSRSTTTLNILEAVDIKANNENFRSLTNIVN